jgi:hypothetical protein
MGRVVRGANCPWGELSVGRFVRGANCPWGELSMGRIVHGATVRGANCPWSELSVGRVVVGRVSMGRVAREPKVEHRSFELFKILIFLNKDGFSAIIGKDLSL